MFTNKNDIRKAKLFARNQLNIKDRAKKNKQIERNIINNFNLEHFNTIMFYRAYGSEVNINILSEAVIESHGHIVLPKCIDKTGQMQAYSVSYINRLKRGMYGIEEPVADKGLKKEVDDIDLFFIPGVAFDINGNRIGYGKGYYDTFLKGIYEKKIKIGIAYEVQIVKQYDIIGEMHDVCMDYIATEKQIYNCKS